MPKGYNGTKRLGTPDVRDTTQRSMDTSSIVFVVVAQQVL